MYITPNYYINTNTKYVCIYKSQKYIILPKSKSKYVHKCPFHLLIQEIVISRLFNQFIHIFYFKYQICNIQKNAYRIYELFAPKDNLYINGTIGFFSGVI